LAAGGTAGEGLTAADGGIFIDFGQVESLKAAIIGDALALRFELAQLALRWGLAETFEALAALAEFMARPEGARRDRPRKWVVANLEVDPRDSSAPVRRRINRKRQFPDFKLHRLLWC
jgi:hypothetical protein